MEAFRYKKDSDNIVTITMDLPGEKVNKMSEEFFGYFQETIDRLEKDDIAGVVLTSGKDTFFAGGDLNALLSYNPEHKEKKLKSSLALKANMRRLETLGKPVVAAINGAALGGGFELCLCTHHRIAMKNPKSLLGLPEVTLGLLPGAGGIVRVVRMLGLEKGLPYLLEGTKMSPEEAVKARLVDELAEDEQDMLAKAKAWIKANPEAMQPWDEKGYQIPGGTMFANPKVAQLVGSAPATLKKRTRGLLPAPEAILSVAVEGMHVDFETALRIETKHFLQLLETPVAKNLITNFFQMNDNKSGANRPEGFPKSKIGKVGILGAGMMGGGIAYAAAKAGIAVVLKDVTMESAEKGKNYSTGIFDKLIAKGRSTDEAKEAHLSLITATAQASDLAGCDLIIEAVFEDTQLKHTVTKEAEPFLADGGIFASNTSTLPITGLAEASGNPANFIGLHFFSPVDKMPLVEIICGKKTSDETLARSIDFVQQIKKTAIVVNDSRGFFTSRVFTTFLDEGSALLEDGVDPMVIDNLSKQAGMPVGPLTMRDEVSLKLGYDVRKANRKLVEEAGEEWPEMSVDRVLRVMVEQQGRLGKAYNGGFYDYPENGRKKVWPKVYELFPRTGKQIPHQDIKDRILFRQSIEAVKCLQEGVLRSVADCNIGSILGIGFPPYTGGQLQYVNTYGVGRFVVRARELAKKYGERFTPPDLLVKKAEKGETFV
jgi:3-hydroxyacyl-CoA dehydrogenase/enoyl-CoA hydratase/3-hydroxybutyryl-CoA epimerase